MDRILSCQIALGYEKTETNETLDVVCPVTPPGVSFMRVSKHINVHDPIVQLASLSLTGPIADPSPPRVGENGQAPGHAFR